MSFAVVSVVVGSLVGALYGFASAEIRLARRRRSGARRLLIEGGAQDSP